MMETIKSAIRAKDTEAILECLVAIGGGNVSTEERMVRAALIDVYIERTSPDAGDALMDMLGM